MWSTIYEDAPLTVSLCVVWSVIWTEPLITPLGKIEFTLPLVTVPNVVIFPCVKCSFALYPLTEESVTCEEPDITPSPLVFMYLESKVDVNCAELYMN